MGNGTYEVRLPPDASFPRTHFHAPGLVYEYHHPPLLLATIAPHGVALQSPPQGQVNF